MVLWGQELMGRCPGMDSSPSMPVLRNLWVMNRVTTMAIHTLATHLSLTMRLNRLTTIIKPNTHRPRLIKSSTRTSRSRPSPCLWVWLSLRLDGCQGRLIRLARLPVPTA